MNNSLDNSAPTQDTPPSQNIRTEPRKYLFDTEFNYSHTEADIQSINPKQLSQSNAQVKESSYNEGYQKGINDTNESINRTAGDQLFIITGKIDDLIQTEAKVLESFHKHVAQICELIASKIMPALLDQGAFEEIKNLLDQAYKHLPKDKTITVSVHHDLVELIQDHIKESLSIQEKSTDMIIKEGDNFEKADCTISWEGAGIEHYVKSTLDKVRESLLPLAEKSLELQPKATLDDKSQEEQTAKTSEALENPESPEAEPHTNESLNKETKNIDPTEA